jgi:hypothetical protein
VREAELLKVFKSTKGRCHFCGDRIKFENRGWSENPDGHWEADHVFQRAKGGAKTFENCLPACTRCNRLRWHRTGKAIRDLLLYGLIAVKEIKGDTCAGRQLKRLKKARREENDRRRAKRKEHIKS